MIRLCAWRALVALALKRAMKLSMVRTLRLFLVGLLLLSQPLGAGPLESGIAAAVEGQLAVFQMHHVVHHRIEKSRSWEISTRVPG